jgi:predicted hydrocarbon binding protein
MDRVNDTAVVNAQFRHILLAIRQVLGEKGAKDIYQFAKLDVNLTSLPPDNSDRTFKKQDYAHLLHTIEVIYGDRGPRILHRIGKESFHIILRDQPGWMGTAKRVMSLWTPEQRIEFMLEAIIDTQRKTDPQTEIWLEAKDGQLAFIEQTCLVCYGRQSSQPACYLTTGFISEAIHWATEMEIEVKETACAATGDAYCRFTVETAKHRSHTT